MTHSDIGSVDRFSSSLLFAAFDQWNLFVCRTLSYFFLKWRSRDMTPSVYHTTAQISICDFFESLFLGTHSSYRSSYFVRASEGQLHAQAEAAAEDQPGFGLPELCLAARQLFQNGPASGCSADSSARLRSISCARAFCFLPCFSNTSPGVTTPNNGPSI